MGEFKTSFSSILRSDLKHIYSGFPQTMKYRHSPAYPTQEQLRQQAENQELRSFVLKSSEFVPEYNCLIPRAPAFRILSRHELNSAVDRLRKPTVASQGIANTSDKKMLADKERNNSKYMGLKAVDDREMTMITDRLTRPTQSSRIREYQTKTKLAEVN